MGDARRARAWHDGVKGAFDLAVRRGVTPPGADVLVAGDLPVESGLSSSASYLVACVLAVWRLAEAEIPMRDAALAAKEVENDFVGVPCGLLDQISATLCREGHALFFDCRSLEARDVPVPANLAIVVGETGVKRRLTDRALERRVRECA
ncbi:MAG: hypothetical protein M5R36_10400 [Deltaproteobacteria bacterium]|nr:hypothetical protein [Deltaproteobacteria bacterium]